MANPKKDNQKKEKADNKNAYKQSLGGKSDSKKKQKTEKDYSPAEDSVIGDGSAGLSGTSAI